MEFLTKYRTVLSIFEYDAEKEYEKMRHTIRQAALAEGRAEGHAEGRNAERIAMIRKKHQSGKSTANITAALELEESYVKAVTEILKQSPALNDEEIAQLIMSTTAEK